MDDGYEDGRVYSRSLKKTHPCRASLKEFCSQMVARNFHRLAHLAESGRAGYHYIAIPYS
jgi:hypothetical protein